MGPTFDRLWPLWGRLVDLHVGTYKASGGRIGHRVPGAPPMLLLDHVGAKSLTKRTCALAYIEDGENVVLVASKGGHPRHPGWLHNLRAHPDVTVQIGTEHRRVRAREADPTEHQRLWPKAVAAYSGYRGYQERAERQIPLVILEPRSS